MVVAELPQLQVAQETHLLQLRLQIQMLHKEVTVGLDLTVVVLVAQAVEEVLTVLEVMEPQAQEEMAVMVLYLLLADHL